MRSKKAVYNVLTNLLLQIVTIIYGFVVPKIIIDHFGSDVNGLIASITQFLAYISLLESGFGPVVKAVLYKPIATKNKLEIASILKTSEKFFRRIALIFVVYIVVLCVVFPLIAKNDFDLVFTVSMVIIIGASTFAEYFFGITYKLFLQAKQKIYVISMIQIITYVLAIIFVVVLAMVNADVIAIKLATMLMFLLRPIIQNLYVKKKYHIDLKTVSSGYHIEQKWDGLAQHIASVIHGNTDVVVLTIFATLSEVSVYSVYALVLNGIRRITQAFNTGIDSSFGDMLAKKESENLGKNFSAYELLYSIIVVVLFACTLILITPFVQIYTSGVFDADYVRPLFGYLITLSEFVWAIRLPYSSLTLAAGHFKETRKGAWIEAIVNIVLSVILVINFGLVGVAIGTLVAMIIRTVEFVYHANRYILKRSIWSSVKKILLSITAIAIAVIPMQIFYHPDSAGYLGLMFDAFIVAAVAVVIVIAMYSIFYREEMCTTMVQIKKILKYRKK